MKPLSAIIVDDEQLARRGLSVRLKQLPDVEILAECANGQEALIAVAQQGKTLQKSDVLEFLNDKLHKMALPDDVVFTDELPHTATGKINKLGLRETYKDYSFPEA